MTSPNIAVPLPQSPLAQSPGRKPGDDAGHFQTGHPHSLLLACRASRHSARPPASKPVAQARESTRFAVFPIFLRSRKPQADAPTYFPPERTAVRERSLRHISGGGLARVSKNDRITRQRVTLGSESLPKRLHRKHGVKQGRKIMRAWCDLPRVHKTCLQILFDALLREKAGRVEMWAVASPIFTTSAEKIGFRFINPLTGCGLHGAPVPSREFHE